MTLSELQKKDIVNVFDGKRLGRIVDAMVSDDGMILHFIVEPKRLFYFFHFKEEVEITYQDIKKIGQDVVLVEFTRSK